VQQDLYERVSLLRASSGGLLIRIKALRLGMLRLRRLCCWDVVGPSALKGPDQEKGQMRDLLPGLRQPVDLSFDFC